MKILKFGGSSISSLEGLRNLSRAVEQARADNSPVVLVISAFEGVTDRLVRMSHLASIGDASYKDLLKDLKTQHSALLSAAVKGAGRERVESSVDALLTELENALHGVSLIRDVSPKALDLIMSYGERSSALTITEFLREKNPRCRLIDSRTLVQTDSTFGYAKVLPKKTEELIRNAITKSDELVVVTGFIASSELGETTTLGRGGSDYTAALLASALGADSIEFWTTVDGIMTADPKKVARAFTVPALTYEEALELGHFGAKVIHAPAMQPAQEKKIPIRIKNTFRPEQPGSLISDRPPAGEFLITGVTSISNVALFQLEGLGPITMASAVKRLFDALSKAEIEVFLISQASSELSICFAVSAEQEKDATAAVREEFALDIETNRVELIPPETEHSIIAAVGANMRHRRGVAGRLFQALAKNGINIVAIAQGSSELNISAVIARVDESKALNALHAAFFLADQKTINLFLAGVGLVGKTLLEQIAQQRESLAERRIELRLVGVTNSRKMKLDAKGISPKQYLDDDSSAADIVRFVEQMRDLNLPNSIFVDCSASDDVSAAYPAVLSSSVSIVTANKRANSGSLERYHELRELAERGNVKFFYETNVGAGLPIIGTLNDLILSGDEIIKIEAVLSGTLSYIFNSFGPGKTFSSVVRDAKAKGYTEPDPRDDLSGKDVARKLLILARESGLALEESDIEVESLVPERCRNAASADEFLVLLEQEDAWMEKIRSSAEGKGQSLRYIGVVEKGSASVALQAVSSDHPFTSLSGSDNIVSFTTKRYFDRPLVIKGPGAGTDVTAAGVLADILRVTSYLV